MIARRTFAGILIALTCLFTVAASADDGEKTEREPVFEIGEIDVPEGDVADVVEFLEEMTQLQNDITSDYRKAVAKINAAQSKAANQILEDPDNLTDDQFGTAARIGLAVRVRGINNASPEEQGKTYGLVKRQLSIAVDQGLERNDLTNARMLASYLERYGDPQLAMEANRTFADLVNKGDNASLKRYADAFEGSARRLALLGNELELEGIQLDGAEFDWASYHGKVVLVDFWATWCGPCRAEAPNVRKHYDIYHDLGFEVVGISLDSKKEALQEYLKKEEIPWVNLFQDGAGWKHPMAVKYGIHAIPTVFLVNTAGKVVSLRARGSELGQQLEKLLGPKTLAARGLAADGKWDKVAHVMKETLADEPGNLYYHWALAAAQLLDGDAEAYQETCKQAWDQRRDSDMWAQARLAMLCCLSDDSGVDTEAIDQLATEALGKSDNNKMKLASLMAHYRSGDYAQCIEVDFEGGNLLQDAIANLTRAMAADRLGRKDEAAKWYAEGSQIVKEKFSDYQGQKLGEWMPDHWICCAVAEVLHGEAKKMLD